MSENRNPILNSPYEEPQKHYRTLPDGKLDYEKIEAGRRQFNPFLNTPVPVKKGKQGEIFDQVRSSDKKGIAYWMVDENYDGSNFIVTQLFFSGGDGKEFDDWEKGISDLVKRSQKKKAENSLRLEIDEEAFDRLYGYTSHPIERKDGKQRIAVRVVSQFGEESMKVLEV